jgi:predicted ATPase
LASCPSPLREGRDDHRKPNFFVFTGGGGTGKTALIRHLQAAGERVVEENIRAVIREQVEAGGEAVPWIDAKACCDLTTQRDIADFDRLAGETTGSSSTAA